EDMVPLHPTNRGVGLYGDKVYFAAAEAVLVALDAKTGKEVWTTKVDDYKKGYYMSLAPLVIDGKVLLGASGGEVGVRGFLAAFDAETGKELWKTYTVPAPGEPGSETWPAGGVHYKRGGGSIWVTGTYDPDTNLTFWGTGNGGPWFGDQRPGDNLYTSSVVAFDATSGAIKGHFQYHPNDSWDWDEVSPPIVVDYQRDGKTVKGLVNVARNGYLWQLERTNGKINFIDGQPFVRQNVFKSLDPKTGRPDIDEARKPGTGKTAEFCPSLWGGKDWPPVAYSPQTRMMYIPANDNLCTELAGEPVKYVQGERYMGVAKNVLKMVAGSDHIGELQAWDLDTGKKGMDDQPAVVQLGSLARHRRRASVRGRHERSHVPRLRCQDRQDPVGIPDRLRGCGGTGFVSGRRQAIHRGSVRLGRGPRQDAGPHEPDLPRSISGGAAGRRDLGFCGEVRLREVRFGSVWE
ncbi:MAG: hypothetical protein QOE78_4777, partial [Alphaproteobacteria bacterium]|nr:hypothetical protein [Alphaproteobacteria bacterium]